MARSAHCEDYPQCKPRFGAPALGVARARTLRLLRAADVFDARLDRFVAISFFQLLHRRHRHRRGELAAAASPLWAVAVRYRGEMDHVGLKDRSTDDRERVDASYGLAPSVFSPSCVPCHPAPPTRSSVCTGQLMPRIQ